MKTEFTSLEQSQLTERERAKFPLKASTDCTGKSLLSERLCVFFFKRSLARLISKALISSSLRHHKITHQPVLYLNGLGLVLHRGDTKRIVVIETESTDRQSASRRPKSS